MEPFLQMRLIVIALSGILLGSSLGIFLLGPAIAPIIKPTTPPETTSIELDISGFESNPALRTINIEADDSSPLTAFPYQLLESDAVRTQLSTLVIHKGTIADLPHEIDALQELRILKIFQNNLTTLPPTIGSLTQLTKLTVIGNLLVQLPEQIGNLSSVQTLVLNDNALDILPESIGNLTQLRVLDIRNNNISTLPQGIQNLQSLETLFLGGNPMDKEQIEAIRRRLPNAAIYF